MLGAIAILAIGGCEQGNSINESLLPANDRVIGEADAQNDAAKPSATSRPNRIILISLDTVGARNVGGYSDARTPNLEKIAKDGVRFDRFYSASTYTLPAHMSMLTGLDAIEHGVVNSPSRLDPNVPTLASELQKAGYETKAIVEGGFVKANRGFDQGFSDFTELKKHKGLVSTSIWGLLDWMRSKEDAPYFLFLHTYVAHSPYAGFDDFRSRHPELDLPSDEAIAELKTKYNREKHYPAPPDVPIELRHMCTFYNMNSSDIDDWLGCGDKFFWKSFLESRHFEAYREGLLESHREGIRRGDRMVGQVRDALIELGQLEDTLLIVTSDHGEGMFEHSIHGHDYLPHDEVVKVPLFLSYPRKIPGGQVVRGLSWHLDLYPTILSFAQIPLESSLLGEDLSSVVLDEETIDPDRTIHPLLLRSPGRSHLPMRRMTIKGAFKFIPGSEHYGDADGLLFDLENSPNEDANLRTSNPEVFDELSRLALDFDGSLTPGEPIHQETGERLSPFPGDVNPFKLPPEDQKELEALGYLFDDPEDS